MIEASLAKHFLRELTGGKTLAQETIQELYLGGYIQVREITDPKTSRKKVLPILITERGERLLES